jgi:hypothetical protein
VLELSLLFMSVILTPESAASQKQKVNCDYLSHDMYLRRAIGDAGRPHAVACLTEPVTDINPRDKRRIEIVR